MRTAVVTILALLLLSVATLAQVQRPLSPPELIPKYPEQPAQQEEFQSPTKSSKDYVAIIPKEIAKPGAQGRSIVEIYLSLGVLLFGLIILCIEVGVLWRQRQGWGVNSTCIVGLTLVVVCGVFLITAGYSESQIAPTIGLLGTIVGYLLGKSDSPSK